MPLKKLLGAALLAGLFASGVTVAFHWFFTEPVIDRAVEIEARSADHVEEPVVSRPMQKFGLVVGFVLYGLAWGALLGSLAYALAPQLAGKGKEYFLLAVVLGWSVALFPLLKYPANPPGVGEAATIGYRQELFLAAIALSLVGMIGTLAARHRLRRAGRRTAALIGAAYAAYLVVIYAALPQNPDPVKADGEMVFHFRLLSFAGQVLFWTALGGAFSALARVKSARM
jgi:putative cobalt transporter subunit CbtA